MAVAKVDPSQLAEDISIKAGPRRQGGKYTGIQHEKGANQIGIAHPRTQGFRVNQRYSSNELVACRYRALVVQYSRTQEVEGGGDDGIDDHRQDRIDVHYPYPPFCASAPRFRVVARTRVSGISFLDAPVVVSQDLVAADAGDTERPDGYGHNFRRQPKRQAGCDLAERISVGCERQRNDGDKRHSSKHPDHPEGSLLYYPVVPAINQE